MDEVQAAAGVERRYVAPGWFTRRVFNRAVAGFTRLGVSVWGSRVLQVRGRRSGDLRETPVNLLVVDGRVERIDPKLPLVHLVSTCLIQISSDVLEFEHFLWRPAIWLRFGLSEKGGVDVGVDHVDDGLLFDGPGGFEEHAIGDGWCASFVAADGDDGSVGESLG